MKHYLQVLGIIVFDYVFIFLCVLPFAFASGGIYAVIMAGFVSFICTFHGALQKKHAINITLGATSGFLISLILWAISALKVRYWETLELAFLITFCISFIIGMLPYSINLFFSTRIFAKSKKLQHFILLIGVIFLCLSIGSLFLKANEIHMSLAESALIRGLLYGICVGLLYSIFVRDWLLPSLKVFSILIEYIRAMLLPISTFFTGYFLIVFTFSGIFGVLSLLNPSSFIGATVPWRFNEYIYYAFISITTVGDADIYAHSTLAKWLTVGEVVLGLMWTTVVLAATIAYLQRTFSKLGDKYHKREEQ